MKCKTCNHYGVTESKPVDVQTTVLLEDSVEGCEMGVMSLRHMLIMFGHTPVKVSISIERLVREG